MCLTLEVKSKNIEYKSKKLKITKLIFTLDSFSVIPNSLSVRRIDSTIVPQEKYLINEIDSRIKLLDSSLIGEQIILEYDVFPVLLSKNYYRKIAPFIDPEDYAKNYWKKQPPKNSDEVIKSGSISRQVMIGNNQDLSMISNIDMRISGKLSENINIEGVISDNNLPFQSDGNTYKLQEFDKIYMKFSDQNKEIVVGDIKISNSEKYLKYNKKLKGAMLRTSSNNYNSNSSFSMSRGTFHKNSINGEEGNQGPYKLVGPNNERYIIILSGTEKVFIDGKKLIRGHKNDYIVNYNSSEIIFTNKNLITQDKRIYVEFEYVNRSYAQSVFHTNHEFYNESINFKFNLISQKDWKNNRYQNDLSDDVINLLSQSGDNINNVIFDSADSLSNNENQILYKKKDTIINNVSYSYYEFSNNPNEILFQVKFTEVGKNNGNYILDLEEVNGRVYEWVAPIYNNNEWIQQGNYSNNIIITTPKSKNVIYNSIEYKIGEDFKIEFANASEIRDENLFSNMDDEDNISTASNLSVNYKLFQRKKLKMKNKHSIEYINKSFQGLSPYQEVEFNRNWNLTNIKENHILTEQAIAMFYNDSEVLKYSLKNLRKGKLYNGYKHNVNFGLSNKNHELESVTKITDIKFNDLSSNLIQSNNLANYTTKKHTYNLTYNHESIINFSEKNILQDNSSSFNEVSINILKKEEADKIKFLYRNNKRPSKNLMINFSNSKELSFNKNLIEKSKFKMNSSLNARELIFLEDSLSNELTLLSNNNINIQTEFLQGQINYNIGKGKESIREKNFIKVPIGQGTHMWIDNNKNGIEELDEFVISTFQDQSEYVQLFLPSEESQKVYKLIYSQNFKMNFDAITKIPVLSKFKMNSSYEINNKSQDPTIIYSPFTKKLDSSINLNCSNRNSIKYKPKNDFWNLEINNSNIINHRSFSYGEDRTSTILYNFLFNLNFNTFNFDSKFTLGEHSIESNNFINKNYSFLIKELNESFLFKINSNKDLNANYIMTIKNPMNSNKMKSDEISISYSQKQEKSKIILNSRFIHIQYDPDENSILNYNIMNGLNAGTNLILEIKIMHKMKNNLDINISYSGRKSQNSRFNHTGNVGIQTFF